MPMRGLAWFAAAVALSTDAHGQSGALDLLSSVGGRSAPQSAHAARSRAPCASVPTAPPFPHRKGRALARPPPLPLPPAARRPRGGRSAHPPPPTCSVLRPRPDGRPAPGVPRWQHLWRRRRAQLRRHERRPHSARPLPLPVRPVVHDEPAAGGVRGLLPRGRLPLELPAWQRRRAP